MTAGSPAGPDSEGLTSYTRSRSRSTAFNVPIGTWYQKRYYKPVDCTSAADWYVTASGSRTEWRGKSESMTDTVVPDFHKRRLRGEVFFNPMAYASMEWGASSGSNPEVQGTVLNCTSPNQYYDRWRYENMARNMFTTVSGPAFSAISPAGSPADLTSLITEASTCCMGKRGRSDTNLYETLAELDKSAVLLQTLFKQFSSVIFSKGLGKKLREGSSSYLAIRYGLQPIIRDIEAVVSGMATKAGRVRQTSRCSVTSSYQGTITGPSIDWDTWYNFRVVTQKETTYTVRAMSLDEYNHTLADSLGLSGKSLAVLPWELVSYSFVADWIVNIGDYLSALIPAFGWNQLGSCYVVETKTIASHTAETISTKTGWVAVTPVSGNKTDTYITRYRVPGLLAPNIVIKNDFRLENMTRAMDAAALIVQKLRFL